LINNKGGRIFIAKETFIAVCGSNSNKIVIFDWFASKYAKEVIFNLTNGITISIRPDALVKYTKFFLLLFNTLSQEGYTMSLLSRVDNYTVAPLHTLPIHEEIGPRTISHPESELFLLSVLDYPTADNTHVKWGFHLSCAANQFQDKMKKISIDFVRVDFPKLLLNQDYVYMNRYGNLRYIPLHKTRKLMNAMVYSQYT
jgi:hypothetical protein